VDVGGEHVAVPAQVLDHLAGRGDRGADRDRPQEAQLLGEVDGQPRQARERGADEPADERPVGDAAAEARLGGVGVVEVQAVGVAAGLRERADVVVRERLRELHPVAHRDPALLAAPALERPVAVLVGGVRADREGRLGVVLALDARAVDHLRDVVGEVVGGHDADDRLGIGDRQLADVLVDHPPDGRADGVVQPHRHQRARHDVPGRHVPGRTVLDEHRDEVGVRDDAHRFVPLRDDQRADVVRLEPSGQLPDGRPGVDRLDLVGHHVLDRDGGHTARTSSPIKKARPKAPPVVGRERPEQELQRVFPTFRIRRQGSRGELRPSASAGPTCERPSAPGTDRRTPPTSQER